MVGMGGVIGGGVLVVSCVCFHTLFAYTRHTSEEDLHVHQQLIDTRARAHTLSLQLYGRSIFVYVSASNWLAMCFHSIVMLDYLHTLSTVATNCLVTCFGGTVPIMNQHFSPRVC